MGKAPALRGEGGGSAMVLVRITGDEDRVQKTLKRIQPEYDGKVEGLETRVGGVAVADKESTDTTGLETGGPHRRSGVQRVHASGRLRARTAPGRGDKTEQHTRNNAPVPRRAHSRAGRAQRHTKARR
ncbi:hypothetical protein ACFUN8_14475 [Streptomyces sp. NPDC057307]|uniref:hypothetical protein n=1 Tax=Streptomyces sp. NPDC057307 TaxID=3346096 RepID=UPI00363DC21E